MEITVKIVTERGTYEMTGDSSDQFDCWQVDRDNVGHGALNVADMISAAVYEHFNK